MDVKNKANRNAQIKEPSRSFSFLFSFAKPTISFQLGFNSIFKGRIRYKNARMEEDAHYKIW
jgi:hypothetical protein